MDFKEVKTSIDGEHSWYSNYRGNSVGRVLHYLYNYLGLHVADSVQVNNKEVTLRGEVIATIDWSKGFPLFTFTNALNESQIKQANKMQTEMVVKNENE